MAIIKIQTTKDHMFICARMTASFIVRDQVLAPWPKCTFYILLPSCVGDLSLCARVRDHFDTTTFYTKCMYMDSSNVKCQSKTGNV